MVYTYIRGLPIIRSAIILATNKAKIAILVIGKYQKIILAEPILLKLQ